MEVYKITNTVNNKIYVGSTKYTKEVRWGVNAPRSTSTHLGQAYKGSTHPLYEDIRNLGEGCFVLETLESCENLSKVELLRLEDYYIKKYWDEVGEHMMYNQVRQASGHGDTSSLHTAEVVERRVNTNLERYGSVVGKLHESDTISKYSNIYSYRGGLYILRDLVSKLHEDGYELSYSQTRDLVNGGYLSKKNRERYPELLTEVVLFKRNRGKDK